MSIWVDGRTALILLVYATGCIVTAEAEHLVVGGNPVRKVVNLLQTMQKEVKAEGEAETKIYDTFMCYCKKNIKKLKKGLTDTKGKIPGMKSDLSQAKSQKVQVSAAIKGHRKDQAAVKKAIASAQAMRQQEAAAYNKQRATDSSNLKAITRAVLKLSKGITFLQSQEGTALQELMDRAQSLSDDDRDVMMSFLSNTQGSGAPSSQILGILKQIKDEIAGDIKANDAKEATAIKAYEAVMKSQAKEDASLQQMIETKLSRDGELAEKIVTLKIGKQNAEENIAADTKFLVQLEKNCARETAQNKANLKTRTEEMKALAETIKVLNEGRVTQIFNAALPTKPKKAVSFLQVAQRSHEAFNRALVKIHQAQQARPDSPNLSFLVMAMRGKKVGFTKVLKLVDDLVKSLAKEQQADDKKKAYCRLEFDKADDKKKALKTSIQDVDADIASVEASKSTLESEIKTLLAGIKALDKSVGEATGQRKKQNSEYKRLMLDNNAAKKILVFARNRLDKFYNPKMYDPRLVNTKKKLLLTQSDRIAVNMSMVGSSSTQVNDSALAAPPPPPQRLGAYKSQRESNGGVLALMNLIVTDIDKKMTTLTVDEKDNQKDYKKFMQDAKTKRADDSRTVTQKQSAVAALKITIQGYNTNKKSSEKDLKATLRYIGALHKDCDWLLKFFKTRKQARQREVDSLKSAKAVLKGADYSFIQVESSTRRFLQQH